MERMEQKIKRLIRVAGKRTTAVVLSLLMVVSMLPVVWPSVSAADYVCGLEEHTHTEACAEAACEKAEHTHTDGCYPIEEPGSETAESAEAEKNTAAPASGSDAKDAVVSGGDSFAGDVSESDVSGSDIDLTEAFPVFAQSAAVDGVVVSVSAPIGVFPAGAELSVSKVSASTQSQVDALIGTEADDSYTFDIKVLLDGEEIQPDTTCGEVSVRFALEVPADAEVSVYHIDDGMTGAASMAPVVGDNSVAVVTDSFSVFVVEFTYSWYNYSIISTEPALVSKIMSVLGISLSDGDEITSVVSSDPTKVSVTPVNEGTDYGVTVLGPYTETNITLTINYTNTTYGYNGGYTIKILCGDELPVSGTAGGAEWEINEEGQLRIFKGEGDGNLDGNHPWTSYGGAITSVVVEEGVSAGSYAGGMFDGLYNCTVMDLKNLDVSQVTATSYMFAGCSSMQHYDITGWTTPNLVDMDSMFRDAMYADFDLPSLDTSKVTDMYSMFYNSKDTSLDLSGLDTGMVEDMQCMFYNSAAESINFDGWDTSNVKYMTQFFEKANIRTIDLSSFNLANVEQMINFCTDCYNLVSFDTSSWPNFKPQKDGVRLDAFFRDCKNLVYADLSGFGGCKITDNASYIFGGCVSLKSVNLNGAFDLSGAGSNFNSAFFGCKSLESVDISSLGTFPVDSLSSMLSNCVSLKKIVATNVPVWDTYTGYNLIDLDTVVIGGGMVFEDGVTLDSVRQDCFNAYPSSVYGSWGTLPVNEAGEESNAFFTEMKDGDMYVYYLPKAGESTQKVTVQKGSATTVVDLLENPDYYVIEDVTPDTIITIQFGPTVTVTFKDSTDEAELGKVLIPKGDEATAPETPTHAGVEFLYWATAKNGTTEADLTEVNEDMTVWAVYGIPQVTVTFMDSTDDSVIGTVTVDKGEDVAAPAAPTHEGFDFVLWATEKNGETEATLTAVAGDMTVWAVYTEAINHVVTVSSTGEGTAAPSGETVLEDGDDLDVVITPKNDRISFTVTVNGTEVARSGLAQNGGSWTLSLTDIKEDKAVAVTFTGSPITGAPSVVFDKTSKTFVTNEAIKFKAIGFWADSTTTDFVDGDERYVPLNWHHADPSGDFGGKTAPTDTYTGSFKQSKAGTYTLKVEFQKYVYEDGTWVDKGIVTVDTQYKVTAPSGGSTGVPDTGDHGVSGTVALYVLQIAILSALLCVFSAKKLRKTGEAK